MKRILTFGLTLAIFLTGLAPVIVASSNQASQTTIISLASQDPATASESASSAVTEFSAYVGEGGRPDPTGKGRYFQFGSEHTYPGARVISQLPAGSSCAPAGELVGVRLQNSTREGMAILSELTDKAEVASTPNGIFLCYCAAGYNQLFLLESKPEPKPAPTPTPPTTQRQDQGVAVKVVNNITAAKGDPGPAGADSTVPGPAGPAGASCTIQKVPDQKGKMRDVMVCPDQTNHVFADGKGMSKTQKGVVIGTAATAGFLVVFCAILKKCGKVPHLGPVVTTGGVGPGVFTQ